MRGWLKSLKGAPPRYDLEGNLLSAGRWTYRWEGENRLVKRVSAAWTQPPHPPDPKGSSRPGTLFLAVTLEFVYDGVSRRVQKKPSRVARSIWKVVFTTAGTCTSASNLLPMIKIFSYESHAQS